MSIDNTIVPEIAPSFRFQWEEAQDCYVILYPEGMVKLSSSAGEITKRINGETTISDIITDLEKTFDTSGLESDVMKFLEVAYDKGWIRNKKRN